MSKKKIINGLSIFQLEERFEMVYAGTRQPKLQIPDPYDPNV